METDLEEEEDRTELAEETQRFLVAHESEERRTEEHARADLGEDGRDADALCELGREPGRDEEREEPEEEERRVHLAQASKTDASRIHPRLRMFRTKPSPRRRRREDRTTSTDRSCSREAARASSDRERTRCLFTTRAVSISCCAGVRAIGCPRKDARYANG